ncbi:MAG: hypothetical protein A2937_00740 [Candidatus Yonathbacteria bacterium RIFCSPLOWO2_01_FULL_47_33b]|uniref:Uncharacterized protein n=1 Tax=Candidatus Yonathbacteria bacterium RIFCSPLOWO2_01_FULL_47_33b TaxID=1802727 RepID=A0A1G2SEE6_9BACT|nr:MAG: hypothetical protein A2937_00740 [Candidatus Yonathbacteria bacterium RIFCSPLOWO2_01_FULL_47_33b]
MDLILAVLNVGSETIGLGVDPIRKAYLKLVGALWVLIGIMLIGLVCNVFGHPEVNIILSSLFAVVTAILWWRPRQVAEVAVAGAIIGDGSLSEGAKWILRHYFSVFKTVLLVGTIVLFYLGFVPFTENPGAFFVIIAGSIAVSLMADQWKYGGEIGKKLVFYGACTIIGFAVVSLIPQGFWGSDKSFLSEWALSIKGKEGGIFVLALLLAVILTLFDERSNAKKESRGSYTVLIFILFAIMVLAFKPPALHKTLDEYKLGGKTWSINTHRNTSTQRTTPKQPQARTVVVLATQVAFTEVKIPASTDFRWDAPEGCLVAIEYDGAPQGVTHDCSEHVDLGGNIRRLRLGFSSKTETPVKVTVTLTPV